MTMWLLVELKVRLIIKNIMRIKTFFQISCSVLTILLLIVPLVFTSCATTVTQTLTTTTTVPPTTSTQTVNSTNIIKFLAGAKNIYTNGGIVQGDAPALSPTLKGISESDFLSLTVQSDTVISMSGISYNYVAINPGVPAEVKLGTYLIDFSRPNLETTGGEPISIQIYNRGNSGLPFSSNFTYFTFPS